MVSNDTKSIMKSKMESRIRVLYNEYKQFIGYPSMPDLQIVFKNALSCMDSLRRVDFSTIKPLSNGSFLLTTFLENEVILGKGFSAHYYHEFTHIYDHITLGQMIPSEQRMLYLKVYSEFHATIVELQKALGFISAQEIKQITGGQSIPNLDNNKLNISNSIRLSLVEYISRWTDSLESDIKAWISEYKKNSTCSDALAKLYKSCVNHAIYYYAYLVFTQRYCLDAEEMNMLFNMELFKPVLGNDFQRMLDMLKQENITDDDLKKIDALLETSQSEFLKNIEF